MVLGRVDEQTSVGELQVLKSGRQLPTLLASTLGTAACCDCVDELALNQLWCQQCVSNSRHRTNNMIRQEELLFTVQYSVQHRRANTYRYIGSYVQDTVSRHKSAYTGTTQLPLSS